MYRKYLAVLIEYAILVEFTFKIKLKTSKHVPMAQRFFYIVNNNNIGTYSPFSYIEKMPSSGMLSWVSTEQKPTFVFSIGGWIPSFTG